MKLDEDIQSLKQIFEATRDPFDSVDPEDIKARMSDEEKRIADLKDKAKDIIGKGVSVWEQYPSEAWPEGREEERCPVCGERYESEDFQEDEGEWDYELHEYICGNCGSVSEVKFEVIRNYDGTEVIELPEDQSGYPIQARPVESVLREERDPFDSVDPEDIEIRKNQAKDAVRRRNLALMADAMRNPKIPVFVVIIDQGDVTIDKAGDFWYDEDTDSFLEDEDNNVYERSELQNYFAEELSGFMGVGIEILFLDDVIKMRNSLNKLISRERVEGTE